jgi:hypothetical protein
MNREMTYPLGNPRGYGHSSDLAALAELGGSKAGQCFVDVLSTSGPRHFAAAVTARWATHDSSPCGASDVSPITIYPPGYFCY